jgi:hypothetical protein
VQPKTDPIFSNSLQPVERTEASLTTSKSFSFGVVKDVCACPTTTKDNNFKFSYVVYILIRAKRRFLVI